MRKKESGKPKYSEPDFVRVKAKDQVPIQNFWAAVEGYFNPLTEEDRRFLMAKVYYPFSLVHMGIVLAN